MQAVGGVCLFAQRSSSVAAESRFREGVVGKCSHTEATHSTEAPTDAGWASAPQPTISLLDSETTFGKVSPGYQIETNDHHISSKQTTRLLVPLLAPRDGTTIIVLSYYFLAYDLGEILCRH